MVIALALTVGGSAGCASEDSGSSEVPPEEPANPQAPVEGSDTHPDWSPDGTTIAYISNRDGVAAGEPINFEVYRAPADLSEETRLTVNREFEVDVAWSPDGESLLFKSYRDGNDEVYIMDADGRRQRNLTRSPASDGGGSWSPDGSTIVFHSDRGDGDVARLYQMDADGSDVRPFPNEPGPGHSPRWSPDGRRVAFVSSTDGDGEIYVMNADGSGVRRLTDNSVEDGYPVWSPDGSEIAYTSGSFETDRWTARVVDPETGATAQLVGDTDSGNVAWSPDGRRVVFGRYQRYGENGGEGSRLHVLDRPTGRVDRLSRVP